MCFYCLEDESEYRMKTIRTKHEFIYFINSFSNFRNLKSVMFHFVSVVIFVTLVSLASCRKEAYEVDQKGYVVFCPCMGRFGNQADQYLGAILFAKNLDRTLVLPHWVEYPPGSVRSTQVPFDRYFKPEVVAQYHRVIIMQDFMRYLAPKVWPKGKRIAFCYGERKGTKPNDCNARDGNPFDSFWATFDIDFDSSEFYHPLHFNVEIESARKEWARRYPASKYPVLAFTGAPSNFPVQKPAWSLAKYFKFSDFLTYKAEAFIRENLPRPYIAIHLRNGVDWVGACKHLLDPKWDRHMFGSWQCLGSNFERGKLKHEHCLPTPEIVARDVARAFKKYKAKSILIATDSDDMKQDIRKKVKDAIIVRQPDPQDVHLDLALMTKADFFIGNCLSTLSSFAVRIRLSEDLSSKYFGVYQPAVRDEL